MRRRCPAVLARLWLLLLLLVPIAQADAPPGSADVAAIRKSVRTNIFEVVQKKPELDHTQYDRPPPLDLLPFAERTDKYNSIGTAFSLGHNRYVTAAHVFSLITVSQFGPPMLRDADGKVFAIAQITRFSLHADFVEFSLESDPAPEGLPVSRDAGLDEPVIAAGNALGEGIVLRDGLLTSATPEEQDGKWKWLRFSAPASPGNSGGPLLDKLGRVIGVVIRKSENENLNYAVPIAQVIDAPEKLAVLDQLIADNLPFLGQIFSSRLTETFALPLPWNLFAKALQARIDQHLTRERAKYLAAHQNDLLPHGRGAVNVFYEMDLGDSPVAIATQQSTGEWKLVSPELRDTQLPGDGVVSTGIYASGVEFIRLKRPNGEHDPAFYDDSKQFMDLALRGLDIHRYVGPESVRVVSLGAAEHSEVVTDAYGRKWQLREWPFGYQDAYMVVLQLPTPEGYESFVRVVPPVAREQARQELQLLAGQVGVTYTGSLAQWREFLQHTSLLPSALRGVRLEHGADWSLHTEQVDSHIPPAVLTLTDSSLLSLQWRLLPNENGLELVLNKVMWSEDSRVRRGVWLTRVVRPPADAPQVMRQTFDDAYQRRSPFDGTVGGLDETRLVSADPVYVPSKHPGRASDNLVYLLAVISDRSQSLAQISAVRSAASKATTVLEKGAGGDVTIEVPKSGDAQADDWIKKMRDSLPAADQKYGKDMRGRLFSQDVEQYVLAPLDKARTQPASDIDPHLAEEGTEQMSSLANYWEEIGGALRTNADIWSSFLQHNHLDPNLAHGPAIKVAEDKLRAALAKPPSDEWARLASELKRAYVDERHQLMRSAPLRSGAAQHARQSACLGHPTQTSGDRAPRYASALQSPDDFYPPLLRRAGLEGAVLLEFDVTTSGCATNIAVIGSSGSDAMDAAAVDWMDTAQFVPAGINGVAVQQRATQSIAFKLADG